MILNLILIHLIVVVVWNKLNVPNEIASLIMKTITRGKISSVELKKPLGCGLCMTFWITLLYMLIFYFDFGIINIISVSLLSSILTDYSTKIIELIEYIFSTIISGIFRLIDYFTNK